MSTHETENPTKNVVRLPGAMEPPLPPPPTPHSRAHGIVVTSMAVFALLGIAAMLAFITVAWPDDLGRYVMAVFVLSVVGFITCASLAVFTAARGVYTAETRRENEPRA